MYDQRLMDRCIQHALKNPIESRGKNTISRMAALISSGIGNGQWVGVNQYKTHPMMFRFSQDDTKIFLHAEVDALLKCYRSWFYDNIMDLGNYDIYVSRVLKDGTPALAKPCKTCFGALTYFNIRNIYWTKQ